MVSATAFATPDLSNPKPPPETSAMSTRRR